jgi:hypothetical protein
MKPDQLGLSDGDPDAVMTNARLQKRRPGEGARP